MVIADNPPTAHHACMPTPRPHHVAMVAFPDAQLLDVCGPLEVFSRAARLASDEGRRGPPPYTVELLARSAGPLDTSSTIQVIAGRSFGAVKGGIDTLLISGGRGTPAAVADTQLIAFVRRLAPRVRRLASVCTGSFVLAQAGLLAPRDPAPSGAAAGPQPPSGRPVQPLLPEDPASQGATAGQEPPSGRPVQPMLPDSHNQPETEHADRRALHLVHGNPDPRTHQ